MHTALKALLTSSLIAGLLPGASAEIITGTVVDHLGQPVAGININVDNLGSGGDPDVFNDGTDANGFFNTTVTPGGVFTIIFVPQPPNLTTSFPNVNVTGTVDMGTVELLLGSSISGRCVTSLGVPVAGVNLDVIDAEGNNLDLVGGTTDAFGNFAVAVPPGAVEVRFDATPVTFQLLASQAFDVDASADVAMGDVVLPNGFHINTIVQGPGGVPVSNADTDTIDAVTGVTLYTPKDNTSALGLASVVVPAGTYEFQICPSFASHLVAKTIAPVVVAADVNLGLTALQAGQVLQGTVNSSGGLLAGVDIDVRDPNTLVKITTCGDNTNGSGQYAVIVPIGTWNVDFTPPYALPYGSTTQASVAVGGTTTVNATVPDCAFHTAYGTGKAGSGGFVPLLSSSGGAPRLGNPNYKVELSKGLAGATAPLLLSFGQANVPYKGGTILVDLSGGFFLFYLPMLGPAGVPGAGGLSIPAAVPNEPLLVGATLYAQFFVLDSGAGPAGLAFSNGMAVTYCD